MDLTERRVRSETAFEGRVFTVRLDDVTLPDGAPAKRDVVLHPGGVGVLARDERGRVLLIRQYRYAAGRVVLEIPAGKLEPGEDPAECGRRELAEETGYVCGELVSLGCMLPTPGYCSELIHLFLASDLKAGETSPDDGEFVEPFWVSFEQAERMAGCGEISDGKTLAALYRFRLMKGR